MTSQSIAMDDHVQGTVVNNGQLTSRSLVVVAASTECGKHAHINVLIVRRAAPLAANRQSVKIYKAFRHLRRTR